MFYYLLAPSYQPYQTFFILLKSYRRGLPSARIKAIIQTLLTTLSLLQISSEFPLILVSFSPILKIEVSFLLSKHNYPLLSSPNFCKRPCFLQLQIPLKKGFVRTVTCIFTFISSRVIKCIFDDEIIQPFNNFKLQT